MSAGSTAEQIIVSSMCFGARRVASLSMFTSTGGVCVTEARPDACLTGILHVRHHTFCGILLLWLVENTNGWGTKFGLLI